MQITVIQPTASVSATSAVQPTTFVRMAQRAVSYHRVASSVLVLQVTTATDVFELLTVVLYLCNAIIKEYWILVA